MMDYTKVTSIESLQLEKYKLRHELNKSAKRFKRSASYVLMPEDRSMLHSEWGWIRFLGYGITAYKTYQSVRKVLGLFRK